MPQDTGELLRHVGELVGSGRLNEAADLLRAATEREPENAVLLVTLGDVLARSGRTIPARRCYRRVLERDAGDSVARVQLARLLAHLGETTPAIEQYRQAITWRSDTTHAYTELAALLVASGDRDGGIEVLSRLTEREPDAIDALTQLGDLLLDAGRSTAAEASFRKALAVAPHAAEVLVRLGASLRRQDRYDEARIVLAQATHAAPHLAEAALMLTDLHMHLGQHEQALQVLRNFLAQRPADAAMHLALARYLDGLGQLGLAREEYEAARALDPGSEEALVAHALFALREGDQAQGWLGLQLAAQRTLRADNPGAVATEAVRLPLDLRGKTVLLHADGIAGDELLFLRYLPRLAARGARILYRASAETHLLLRQRRTGIDAVIGPRDELAQASHAIQLAALPWLLAQSNDEALPGRGRAAFVEESKNAPHRIPLARRAFWPELPASLHLEPNAARLKFWGERLAEVGKPPYTAVAWRAPSGFDPGADLPGTPAVHRELPLDALGCIIGQRPGTPLSMQRAPQPDEIEQLITHSRRKVHDFARANNDFEDVLALLALVDEYVCVSDPHLHLRAALGRPARVLVPWPPHWRWMAWGRESPWFPGYTLYRQRPDGSWSGALKQLAAALAVDRGST